MGDMYYLMDFALDMELPGGGEITIVKDRFGFETAGDCQTIAAIVRLAIAAASKPKALEASA